MIQIERTCQRLIEVTVANVEKVGGVNGETTAHILPPVDGLRNTRAADKSTQSSTP
jgi:hypothetical protein